MAVLLIVADPEHKNYRISSRYILSKNTIFHNQDKSSFKNDICHGAPARFGCQIFQNLETVDLKSVTAFKSVSHRARKRT
jgi:hypothetical protein